MSDMKKKIEDWMVRVSFAEVGAADEGFQLTGEALDHKSRLAMDRLRIVRGEMRAESSAEDERRASLEEATGAVGELRLMVIDDEPIVGRRLKPALEKSGFLVEVFQEPTAALARLAEQHFDIVVTDLRMQGTGGIQILEYVMANCPGTRVVLMTGYATVEVAREALVKGAFDFISKPFKANDLRAVINKAALSLGHKGVT